MNISKVIFEKPKKMLNNLANTKQFGNENEKVYFTKSQFKELLKLATLDNHFYFKLMVRFITKLMAWQWEVL